MASYAIATALAGAHAYFLYSQRDSIVGKPTDVLTHIPFWAPLLLASAYTVFVYVGLRFMKKREPIDVSAYMTVYNVYETLLSAWMMITIARETFGLATGTFDFQRDLIAVPVEPTAKGSLLAYALWVNYQSKFLEYADTVFMIARKKEAQVTPLHVIHHGIMGPVMWLVVSQAPGAPSAFGPMLNSGVHTLMYSYYFFTGIGVRMPVAWKQTMTTLQLVQFVLVMYHALFHTMNPGLYWPVYNAIMEVLLMILMLYMFGGFFIESYMNGDAKKAQRGGKKKERDE